jgi:redox-sensing transcriptional repressor
MRKIAESTVRRLSLYLRFLEEFEAKGIATVSSGEVARRGGTTSAQVRKDLSLFGSFGKRGMGYSVPELTRAVRDILGLGRAYVVAVVGAGNVGSALARYSGFSSRGFHVRWVYDQDAGKIGLSWNGLHVRDVRDLESDLADHPPDIAVVATPEGAAQGLADRLVTLGVKAFLNFAPIQLTVPEDVVVKNVNMAIELETLSYALRHR